MEQIIDQDFKKITNPVDAEIHYSPYVKSGEMDLMAVQKELKEIHGFTDDDMRITSNSLSQVLMQAHLNQSGLSNSIVLIGIGLILFILGIALTFYLNDMGIIAFAPYLIIGAGGGMITSSIWSILKK